MISQHQIARISPSAAVYGSAGYIIFQNMQWSSLFTTTNKSSVDVQGVSPSSTCSLDMQWVSLSPTTTPAVWPTWCRPFHHHQYGQAVCIPFDCQQYGRAVCIVFHHQQYGHAGYPFPPLAVLTCRVNPSPSLAVQVCRVWMYPFLPLFSVFKCRTVWNPVSLVPEWTKTQECSIISAP